MTGINLSTFIEGNDLTVDEKKSLFASPVIKKAELQKHNWIKVLNIESTLKAEWDWISPNYYGLLCYLIFTFDKGETSCVIVNKKTIKFDSSSSLIKIGDVDAKRFSCLPHKELFKREGSIFEGFILRSNNVVQFMITDLVLLEGKTNFFVLNLHDRMKLIGGHTSEDCSNGNIPVVRAQLFPKKQLAGAYEAMLAYGYKIRGWRFVSNVSLTKLVYVSEEDYKPHNKRPQLGIGAVGTLYPIIVKSQIGIKEGFNPKPVLLVEHLGRSDLYSVSAKNETIKNGIPVISMIKLGYLDVPNTDASMEYHRLIVENSRDGAPSIHAICQYVHTRGKWKILEVVKKNAEPSFTREIDGLFISEIDEDDN